MQKGLIIVAGLLFAILGLLGYSFLQSDSGFNISYAKEEKEMEKVNAGDSSTKELGTQYQNQKLMDNIPVKKLEEQTVHYEEITTNLKGHSFIILKLSAIADSEKSKEEAQKREFQLRNFINLEVSQLTKAEMTDPIKVSELLQQAEEYLNEQMNDGIIYEIFISKKLIQ